jgi:AraC family transcriptional regulator
MNRAPAVPDVLSRLSAAAPRTVRIAFPAPPCDPGIAIAGAGIEDHRSSAYQWHGLQREREPLVVIQHTLAGEGQLRYAGGFHRLTVARTMVVASPHDHYYGCPDGGRWRFCWVMLTGREAVRIVRWIIDSRGPVLDLHPHGAALQQFAHTCQQALDHGWNGPWQSAGDAWRMITALADEQTSATSDDGGLPAAVSRAQAFARLHLGGGLSVTALARAAGLTRSHFTRSFQAATGLSPSQWLADLRLHEGMALLRSGLPAAEAGRRCGFGNASAFARAFHARLGLTPSDYAAGRDPRRRGPPAAANHPPSGG